MYIVRKTAVYYHDIVGIFYTLENASQALDNLYNHAKKLDFCNYSNDFDGHHTYIISKFDIGITCEMNIDGRIYERSVEELRYEYEPLGDRNGK